MCLVSFLFFNNPLSTFLTVFSVVLVFVESSFLLPPRMSAKTSLMALSCLAESVFFLLPPIKSPINSFVLSLSWLRNFCFSISISWTCVISSNIRSNRGGDIFGFFGIYFTDKLINIATQILCWHIKNIKFLAEQL